MYKFVLLYAGIIIAFGSYVDENVKNYLFFTIDISAKSIQDSIRDLEFDYINNFWVLDQVRHDEFGLYTISSLFISPLNQNKYQQTIIMRLRPFDNNIKKEVEFRGITVKKIAYMVLTISVLLGIYFTWWMSTVHYTMKEELERKNREIASLEDEIYFQGMELTKCRLGGKWPHMLSESNQKKRIHPDKGVEVVPTGGEIRQR